jgi:hypothetical protein
VVAPQGEARFEPVRVPLPEADAIDVGFMAHDNELGAFSVNHMRPAAFVIGNADRMVELGLNPTPLFPGLEDVHAEPAFMETPGLYISAHDQEPRGGYLLLRANEMGASGTIEISAPSVVVQRSDRAAVEIETADRVQRIRFSMAAGGSTELWLSPLDLPIVMHVPGAPAFVGPAAVRSPIPKFTLSIRDRHGYAVGDFNADAQPDLFAVLGGFGGGIKNLLGAQVDELLLRQGDVYRHAAPLWKGQCRGRQVVAPDANSDGRSDVFVSCEGAPSRIYLQGEWRMRKLEPQGQSYLWANVDDDPEIELLTFRGKRMLVQEAGVRFEYAVKLRGPPSGRPALGHLHGGLPTLYVPSAGGSSLVRGRRVSDPGRIGLPRRASGAAFVDFDNDGRRDLHVAPDGLFRQGKRGLFRSAGGPRLAGDHVTLSWGELRVPDGRRDLLAMAGERLIAPSQEIRGWLNRTRGAGRWLTVDVQQLQLGDRIVVRTRAKTQTGWVGEAEGSHLSDTHRRVYFGLGAARWANVIVRPAVGHSYRLRTRTNRVVRVH